MRVAGSGVEIGRGGGASGGMPPVGKPNTGGIGGIGLEPELVGGSSPMSGGRKIGLFGCSGVHSEIKGGSGWKIKGGCCCGIGSSITRGGGS